jgi:COP9 signalosome complex subunit 6
MLHERILLLVTYVSDVIIGVSTTKSFLLFLSTPKDQAPKDHATLRALTALIASLPATENKAFREEFETVRCLLSYSLIVLQQTPDRSTRTSN